MLQRRLHASASTQGGGAHAEAALQLERDEARTRAHELQNITAKLQVLPLFFHSHTLNQTYTRTNYYVTSMKYGICR